MKKEELKIQKVWYSKGFEAAKKYWYKEGIKKGFSMQSDIRRCPYLEEKYKSKN